MTTKKHTLHSIINELVDRTNTDIQRIRHLESWEKGLNIRIETIEQQIMEMNASLQKLSQDVSAEFHKRDQIINELRTLIKEIVKRIKRFARKDEVEELEALVDIYSPLKSNFVTRDEVEEIISKRLSRHFKNNK